MFYFLAVRTDTIKKVLILALLVHYAAILYTGIGTINEMFIPDPTPGLFIVYLPSDILIQLGLTAVTFPLVCTFLRRVIKSSLPLMDNPTLHRGCFYLTVALLLYCIAIFALSSSSFYYNLEEYPVFVFLLAIVLTDAILYYMFFSEVQLSIRNRELQDQIRSFDEKYQQISISVSESRRARHDIRHHLHVIGTLYREGKDAELSNYLEQYESYCQELEKMSLSGYSSLDSILRYYIQRAREEGITVQTDLKHLPASLHFDAVDLTVLLGNLMENAIEACRKIPEAENRFLHIWIRLENVSLLMQIENACLPGDGSGTAEYTDGTEFTSTKHSVLRGQGLKSIRFVTEKYGGSAEFKKEAGTFTARIVMNTP